MGVICFDGNVLATDSQSTCEHVRRMGTTQRLFAAGDWDNWKVEGKKALAFAYLGKIGNPGPWIAEALTQGLKHDTTLAVGLLAFDAIIVTEDAAFIWKYHKEGRGDDVLSDLHPIIGATALGSGGPMAVAVMSVGKGAREAVEAVIKFDILSGGLVQTWTRKEPEIDDEYRADLTEISHLAKNIAGCEPGSEVFEDGIKLLHVLTERVYHHSGEETEEDYQRRLLRKDIKKVIFSINAYIEDEERPKEVREAAQACLDEFEDLYKARTVEEARELLDLLTTLKEAVRQNVVVDKISSL